jgi:hypothetical protein
MVSVPSIRHHQLFYINDPTGEAIVEILVHKLEENMHFNNALICDAVLFSGLEATFEAAIDAYVPLASIVGYQSMKVHNTVHTCIIYIQKTTYTPLLLMCSQHLIPSFSEL